MFEIEIDNFVQKVYAKSTSRFPFKFWILETASLSS